MSTSACWSECGIRHRYSGNMPAVRQRGFAHDRYRGRASVYYPAAPGQSSVAPDAGRTKPGHCKSRSGEREMTRVAFVIGDYPSEERARREKVALSYSTSEVQVGIVSAPVTPYLLGLTPTEIALVQPAVISAFREAEKQGYDAIVPLG